MAAVIVVAISVVVEAPVFSPQTQSSGPAQPPVGEEVCFSWSEYLGLNTILKSIHLCSRSVHV